MNVLYLLIPFAPLLGSMIAGLPCLFGKPVPRAVAHWATILGVLVSAIASLVVLADVYQGHTFNGTLYEWATVGGVRFQVGFLIDALTAVMMVVVTSVSLMVHIYTIGYMQDDPGYQRFFSYISLFTFSMLMLVMSNNFLQLFFGWEAVGLVSYLLIGFWYKKPTAIYANLKAFLVNRVGDFGFILGIGLLLAYAGSMDYNDVFVMAPQLSTKTLPGTDWSLLTVASICLFIGAMGKSAQVPLHVWLPDSMEGPTPISALIHAATMVTAGIFMVSRMSVLFEFSDTALNLVLVIGSITALFMGFMGVIQNDIKRVVAYSTLSQLGYMTVALGVSAYPVAIFHLMTHAFFKALLFLAAGSVIIGMHHEQDIRKMGGLYRYMPVTWLTSLIGSLALIGLPPLSGFFSKDSIIEAVHASQLPASGFAYVAVLAGVFFTAFYSFRMFFLVFHGKPRFLDSHGHADSHGHHGHGDDSHAHVPHESPWVVTLPLVLLAIPSAFIGYAAIDTLLYSHFLHDVIPIWHEKHAAMITMAQAYHDAIAMAVHGLQTLPFWLAISGVVSAAVFYLFVPQLPAFFMKVLKPIYVLLDNKYYADKFNELVFAAGARVLGKGLWKFGDQMLIDGALVNGSARVVSMLAWCSGLIQSGRLYHYAFAMILGVLGFLVFFNWY